MDGPPELDALSLSSGIRSRFIDGVNGLRMHVLEAGARDRPLVLLLHGFPELAYSWRHVMPALANAGYRVIAPDQRGYGRTTGWDPDYDGDLSRFGLLNIVRDCLALVRTLGRTQVHAVVGHDFGSPVAAYCALTRPDVFRSVVLMSAPFAGPPSFPLGTDGDDEGEERVDIDGALSALPQPRKHYQHYYSTRQANRDMHACPQGIAAFLRAYFHVKSGDWAGNTPFPLNGWNADELGKMPTYYIMDRDVDMAATVAEFMPSAAEVASCVWLPEEELDFYAGEFARTGFQGGLQWYRCSFAEDVVNELRLFSGKTIDVPACFIAGASDWGVYQVPGALECMRDRVCTKFTGIHLIPRAGHWVQQENAGAVSRLMVQFLSTP